MKNKEKEAFLNGLKRLNEDEFKETGAMDEVTDIERYRLLF